MKMHPEDFAALKAAIEKVLAEHPDIYTVCQKSGHSDTRFNWDVLSLSKFPVNRLYRYLNDSHIDTALRAITGRGAAVKTISALSAARSHRD